MKDEKDKKRNKNKTILYQVSEKTTQLSAARSAYFPTDDEEFFV